MKLKVGDKVRVKDLKTISSIQMLVNNMSDYANKICTITNIRTEGYNYYLDYDCWVWNRECLVKIESEGYYEIY